MTRVFVFLILGLCGALTACSGDRTVQSWFAPDPSLQPSPTNSPSPSLRRTRTTPRPSPSPPTVRRNPETSTEITAANNNLPQQFPEDFPHYPQASKLRPNSPQAVITGESNWETQDSSEEVLEFYREALKDQNWEIITPGDKTTPFIAQKDEKQVQLRFSDAQTATTRYTLTYGEITATPQPSPLPVSLPNLNAVSSQMRGYIQDLAALGVIPENFQPNETITRRTFARWLFAAHNQMYRDRPTKQIRPAPQAENPAFTDIPPNDTDFAIIQGLAEAGIIPSRLTGDTAALLFQPDSPLTREQLLEWKVPLDVRRSLPDASLAAIETTWGFQDVENIDPNVFPELLADFENGQQANILRAFGYTTLLQPKKAVTGAEAAASLWYFGYQGQGISAQEAQQLLTEETES
ncbi:S-layer homology domain-containing protein [Spirulina sp. CS-785/01]|uniref:S-layer homology domain-containing protein n=1 Tax=Spirulina sp. CS-785/01 TaxID=3021716 RepID=UPI00232E43ED|nr:S-layer homology domain-containing protein [Spirulina sp. CS-785/01]MDB9312853.1 S-layer homology domain-containing protein [Spirulina sp. CS-785/01]